ncbi:hypothetical protein [Arthrobacter nitrophenolicus]|jgi:hypothetical protein|uniref:hypothetical protein n=1 Tax=Arthrobacter nitrophenolicus TaxID=683150 RepID=UPI0014051C07|nr:hypothetical protein [Arthrobacter nitrophenolicus]
MHPLAAIGLVFLTGLAWTVTVLTLLIALARARRRTDEGQSRESQSSDEGALSDIADAA